MRGSIPGLLVCIGSLAIPSMATNGSAVAAEMVIVQDGQPRATIVVAKDPAGPAREKTQTAARELQSYIQKISGARLPIVDDAQNPAGPLILVGRSRLSDGLGVAIPGGVTSARREEGFVIACKGDRLLLAGNNDGPYHGTEYAVYDLLRSLGVRWFMPGEFGEIVPHTTTVRVPEQRVEEKPDFVDAQLVAARPAGHGCGGSSLETAEQDESRANVRHLRRQQCPGNRGSRGVAQAEAGAAGPERGRHAQPVSSQPYES